MLPDPTRHDSDAEEQATLAAANAAKSIHLRLLHGLVPVASNLRFLESMLGVLKLGDVFRKPFRENGPGCLERLEGRAREAFEQIDILARGVGYPLSDEVDRYDRTHASLDTLPKMRRFLAAFDEADLDAWLATLDDD